MQNSFASDLGSDLKSLCASIFKSSQNGDAHFEYNEVVFVIVVTYVFCVRDLELGLR